MGILTRGFFVVLCSVATMAGCPGTEDPPPTEDVTDATGDLNIDTLEVGAETDTTDTADTADTADTVDAGDSSDTSDGDVPGDLPPETADVPVDDGQPDVPDAADVPIGKPVAPGDLMISELMVNPVGLSDLAGEWIELRNLSGVTLDLSSCVLSDDDGDAASLSDGEGSLAFTGAFYVIARLADPAQNGGVNAQLALDGFTLSNAADEVKIVCGGQEIDVLRYTDESSGAFPLTAGRALSFDSGGPQTAANNDDPAKWCPAVAAYQGDNYGSPGALNPFCPDAPDGLDGCRLAEPDDVGVLAGDNVALSVEVLEGGITDKTPFVDPFVGLTIEVGHGPVGSDPAGPTAAATWTWLAAPAVNPWSNTDGDGYDRYGVTLSPPVGSRAVVARASLDGGATWSYCDLDGFTADGSAAGSFTVHANPCSPNPCTTPPPANCVDQIVVGYEATGSCTVTEAFSATCEYEPAYQDCSEILGTCVVDQCVGAPPQPAAGDLVISELMIHPTTDGDPDGEWFELTNLSGTDLNLGGCLLRDLGGESYEFNEPLVHVAAGATVLFARASAVSLGGVTPDYVYGNALSFDNDADELQVQCGSVVVDVVAWDAAFLSAGASVIGGPGASIQLRTTQTTSEANDLGVNWCTSVAPIVDGDAGSPGVANPPCAELVAVEKCRLQSPAALTLDATFPFMVVGRIRQQGVTDITVNNDPDPQVLAQAAMGPAGTNPAVDATGWTLVDAAPEEGYVDSGDDGHDSYAASLIAPTLPGEYAVAFRFSADGGASWTFCDRDLGPGLDGSEDGYQPTAAGALTVDELDACSPNPCLDPPVATCTGDVATSHAAEGTCTPNGIEFSCDYLATDSDCVALGGTCSDGACVGVATAPTNGEAIITEMMLADGPGKGQWIELLGTAEVVNLDGCTVTAGDAQVTFFGDAVLFEGERLVVAHSSVSGAQAAAVWGDQGDGITLGDAVSVSCGGSLVDAVDLSSFDPPAQGRSIALDPAAQGAVSNDSPGAWCASADALAGGLFGSPGAANTVCPPTLAVGQCRLDSPATYVGFTGDTVGLEGRWFLAGQTDVSDANDASADLLSECGTGPEGVPPTSASWRYASAGAVPGWDASATADAGWDAYAVEIGMNLGGVGDAACRFSADRGRSWTYCDRDTGVAGSDGSEDGYASADAGKLSLFDPCATNPCTDGPVDSCGGDVLTSYQSPGDCSNNSAVVVCDYPPTVTDCAEKGGTCEVDTCSIPPDPIAGELLMSEFMAAPGEGSSWVEIHNPTAGILNLVGCSLEVDGEPHLIDDDLLLIPGGYVVLASAVETGLGASWIFAGLGLNPVGATLELICAGQSVDTVSYVSGGSWPVVTTARSTTLRVAASDAMTNDLGGAWCLSPDSYTNENFGTPGGPGVACF